MRESTVFSAVISTVISAVANTLFHTVFIFFRYIEIRVKRQICI